MPQVNRPIPKYVMEACAKINQILKDNNLKINSDDDDSM